MTPATFPAYLWRAVRRIGTQQAAAKKWGVSKQFLNDVLKGRRGPGEKLLAALGLREVVTYRRTR